MSRTTRPAPLRRHAHDGAPCDTAGHAADVAAGGEHAVAVPTAAAAPLVVGSADDPVEADADRRAERALRRLATVPGADERHSSGEIHRSTTGPGAAATIGREGGDLDAGSASVIESRRGGGRALPDDVRGRMEDAFGTSLSSVRIHDDRTAAGLNAGMSAAAFTTGNDIFFGAGRFAPHTAEGEHVLAHELGHVLQGRGEGVHRDFLDGVKKFFGKKSDAGAAPSEPVQGPMTEKEARKANAARNDANLKQQGKQLKEDRRKGEAGRAALTEDIYGGSTEQADHGAKMSDLHAEFEIALASEKSLFDELVAGGASEEEARDQAYAQTWRTGPNADRLSSVAPPRETASERLRSDVRKARTAMGVREMFDKQGELGQLLSKDTERTYEQYVSEIDRLQKDEGRSLSEATALAEKTVWGAATEKAKQNRPQRGSAVDKEAVAQARSRLNLRETPQKKAKTTTEKLEAVGSKLETGASVSELVNKPIEKAGDKKDKAAKAAEDLASGKAPEAESGGIEQKIPVVGETIKASQEAKKRVAKGERKDEETSNKAPSDETRAANGISSIVGILQDIYSLVMGGFQFAEGVKKAQETKSARDILAASKTATDGAKTMVGLGTKAAKLATVINPGVSSAVASVVPGLNIATSALTIVSNAITMTDAAMRVSETNTSLADAKGRDSKDPVDVMILPLMRVLQSYTQGLEKAVWDTSVSIADLATAIATVASGGGYGIPAAVQAGVKAVDTLHTFGHFIAKQVLTSITKKSQKASLKSLEGSAEQGFKHDPAMAVDGIILRAAGGDAVAQKFLGNYEVDGKKITPDLLQQIRPGSDESVGNERLLGDVRAAVMKVMGDSAEPLYFYEEWKKKIGSLIGDPKAKWDKVNQLATDRTGMDTKERGLGWKLKMMLKGEQKLGRSVGKTAAEKKNGGPVARTAGVLCTCGGAILPAEASAKQQQDFLTAVEGASDDELLTAAHDPANEPEWQNFVLEALQDRIQKRATTSP